MTRSNAREIAVHLAFEFSFSNETADQLLETAMTRSIFALLGEEAPLYAEFPNEKQRGYIETLVRGVYLHCAELDEYISRYAIGWDFSRLPRVSIAIMRIAMYEILYMQDVPNAAAINEAVELAKHYEDQDMVSFINGILGSFVRRESIPERTPVMAEGIFDAEPEQGEQ
ncbi:MAG TPA: transcription antitermination factor NusB [Pseudoflavonifractor sp.]|nr:transcription antitermination factor NusB [Pseudoflavonifractor sp.]